MPGAAGDLKGRTQIADREGSPHAVGADNAKSAHRRVGQIERRIGGHQLLFLPGRSERLDARRVGAVDQQGEVVAVSEDGANMRKCICGQIVSQRRRRLGRSEIVEDQVRRWPQGRRVTTDYVAAIPVG